MLAKCSQTRLKYTFNFTFKVCFHLKTSCLSMTHYMTYSDTCMFNIENILPKSFFVNLHL